MIRKALSSLARNQSLGAVLSRTPLAQGLVTRVVGGETLPDAVAVASSLADRGLWVSLERAAHVVDGQVAADELLEEYLALVDALAEGGLSGVSEVAVFADALDPIGADRLTRLSRAATASGIAVMIGMGAAEHVDRTLEVFDDLHAAGLLVGVTVQANLRRSESDCVRLGDRRVRLVKGGYRETPDVGHVQPAEIDKAFVRCAKILLNAPGEPSFATHDPRLINVVESLTVRYARPRQTFEFCFYLGRQEGEQERLAAAGDRVRVYVPYGPDWFGRLVGGLAEQPTSIAGAVRSLLPGTAGRPATVPSAPEEE
jgi:proline dehydrogenase